MLTKSSRRVVIIDKIKSDMIEQAIFILKANEADAVPAECGIVAEAQGIIEDYIKQVNRSRAKARSARLRSERKRGTLIPYLALAGAVLLVAALAVCAAFMI